MKYLLALMLILAPFYGFISTELSPNYARMPVNSNQTFTLQLTGDGKIYDLELYGPYLDWQTKTVWVGEKQKTLYFTFSPRGEGTYTITADMEGARDESTVDVYIPKSVDIISQIQNLRFQTDDPTNLAILNEAERLYNESRFELAEIKLNEVKIDNTSTVSSIPKFALAGIIALISIIAVKLLLG
ncbi:MAG: hypothetical protein GOU98_03710 [Candidatus Altiarchaeota archaeon]|nr:hypothetical protein [Candidatus Altiarchaeota archaeon]